MRMMRLKRGLTQVFLLLSIERALAAEDWPQFRGEGGTGVSASKNLPVQFGPEKNVLWQTLLPPGHSSPVLVGNSIFLTAFEDKKLLTFRLDRSSGEILWRREAPRDRTEPYQQTNTPASPTPVTDGQRVYVFFGDFGLLAYDLNGAEVWRLPLGPFNNVNGHGSSPILAGDKLVLICDQDIGSYLIAVDKKTGKPVWKTDRPEVARGYATPGIFQPKNGSAELIVPGAFQLASYSLDTGKKLWWVNGMAWQLKSVPLFQGDVIYVNGWETGGDTDYPPTILSFEEVLKKQDADGDGRLSKSELPVDVKFGPDEDLDHDGLIDARDWNFRRTRRTAQNSLVAVRHGGVGDVTQTHVLWRHRKALPNVPSPLLYQDVLFLVKDGGIVTTLNPKTGEVLKQARLPNAAERYWASPVAADGKVYLASEGGKVSVLKAVGQWEVLAINELADECFATPAIVDGKIYLRTRTKLYCFGLKESK
jgi:outer membrane protein assembly factor BamB